MKIILASKSPRRKELLSNMVDNFDIIESNYQEDMTLKLSNKDLVKELAFQKANEVFSRTDGDRCVIGSDTIVVVNNKRAGKPKTKQEAKQMLEELSGKSHFVYTGLSVIICRNGKKKCYNKVSSTKVFFKKLTNEEIQSYIDSGEPMDKAGAYGIQGYAGNFVKKIDGCYFSVVGLPTNLLYEILKKESII